MLRINRVLIRLAFLSITIVSGGVPSAVYAKIIKLPVVVTDSLTSDGKFNTRIQYLNYVVPDASPLLNQKCDNTVCVIRAAEHFRSYHTSNVSWMSDSWSGWVEFSGGTLYISDKDETVGEFLDRLPTISEIAHYTLPATVSDDVQVCSAIIMSEAVVGLTGYKNFSSAQDAAASGACATGSGLVSCAFKTSAIAFNYGTIDKARASGTTTRQNATVSCTGDVSVALSFVDGAHSIILSNGMAAQLTVNGDQIGDDKEMDLTSGEHNWEIVSTLEGTPESSGPFDGSSVLNINIL